MATDLPTKRIKKVTLKPNDIYDIVPEMLQNSGYALEAPTLTKDETIATESYVENAIDALPEPMIFKGSVGTGGTVTWANLPAASADNEGFTYKVITKHTTAPVCEVGDTIISNGTGWVVIPSGDEPSGTVTSVNGARKDGSHLTVTGGPITSSGTLTVGVETGYSIPSDTKQSGWDAKYQKPADGIPGTDLEDNYYLASNPEGYTSNQGTVTSVRVQATSPVQSSTSTAQSTTLDTTISLADGYGDTKNPYASKTANYVLAAPDGSAGVPSFRLLAANDIASGTFADARIASAATWNAKVGDVQINGTSIVNNKTANLVTNTAYDASTNKIATMADLEAIDVSLLVEKTYSELKSMRDNSQLKPGQLYRITDYNCTTAQENTSSAGHQFDVIVQADAVNKLNEEARAILHSGDTYFANNKLEAWRLWYCLDNDANRFAWANNTSGKGVIYRMIDEFDNDIPYDFKNIIYNFLTSVTFTLEGSSYTLQRDEADDDLTAEHPYAWLLVGVDPLYTDSATPAIGDSLYYGSTAIGTIESVNQGYDTYTFDYNSHKDASLYKTVNCFSNIIRPYRINMITRLNGTIFRVTDSSAFDCYSNIFGDNCYGNILANSCHNNNFAEGCYSNILSGNCYSNEFKDRCYLNNLSTSCYNNTFELDCAMNALYAGCYNNTFGATCVANALGQYSNHNIIAAGCESNTFGSNSRRNQLGILCKRNTFGNLFENNIIGASLENSSFGEDCSNNIIGNVCSSITFGNSNDNNIIENNCQNVIFGANNSEITVGNGCSLINIGDSASATINYCKNIIIDNGCVLLNIKSSDTTASLSNYLQNVHVHTGVRGSGSTYLDIIVLDRNLPYETDYYLDEDSNLVSYINNQDPNAGGASITDLR